MGNHTVAYAVKLARTQVISAYPITPQTQVVELLSEMVGRGDFAAKYITVESEHSAMAACVGGSAAGARTFTATSSQGLALMHEMLHWATGSRNPVVMAVINRSLGPPWNIWSEQTDSLAQRDTGWTQIYAESNQEVFDSLLQAFKIAEATLLPAMVVLDAFILSHTAEPVEIYAQERVDAYLPPRDAPYRLEPGNPAVMGALMGPDNYYEYRVKIHRATSDVLTLFEQDSETFQEHFGRRYGIFEEYFLDDADTVIVAAGAACSTIKAAIRKIRETTRRKVGLLKFRVFRPSPVDQLRALLENRSRIIVLDRNLSLGHSGIFFSELKALLYGMVGAPPVIGYIFGLGGRDFSVADVQGILDDAPRRDGLETSLFWGVRE
jgi:pyruvate/2-oxoacid:ferredoxin oxidoreductase alpha subunit